MRGVSLHELIEASYNGDSLDANAVNEIAKRLSRQELKTYLKTLQRTEQERTVHIAGATSIPSDTNKKLASMFTGKRIEYSTDPELLLGVRIQDNDTVYEANLKNSLEKVVDELEESYE